ncbi:mitochondrial carrier domain-containing protein [Cyclospora cayetanensis]|uniref:Mitochondrial carrier domain-containing protein n=1 Tax=Cyclospora cayetanensis TaxID=88456 RepID=A0A1D3D4V6_9EIME|nr:mitochondrial carrier domain-containing protein [Cyclospora cayetanensis]
MDTATDNVLRYPWFPNDQQGLPSTMASAAVAGLLSRAVAHPLDTVKAVIQVQTKSRDTPKTVFERSRTVRTLLSIWKVDGLRGLYRGFAITSALAIPATCLYFSAYEILKSHVMKLFFGTADQNTTSAELSFGSAFIVDSVCGFSAEAISCLLYLPMDVCKERLQVYPAMRSESSPITKPTLREVVRADGISGLYRGYGATLLSFGPFSALFFTLNHVGIQAISAQFRELAGHIMGPATDPPTLGSSAECRPLLDATVAGAAAGAAAFLTAPLDKVKLRVWRPFSKLKDFLVASPA